jgi:hypothetical protein
MGKVCLANQIGPEACYLLTTVAMIEDAKSYRGAVTFFNEQLMPLVGCRSVDSLARFRSKCVEAGWLHYKPGGKGIPGTYWVVVPAEFERMDDVPVDENAAEYSGFSSAKPRRKTHAEGVVSGVDTAAEMRREPREKPRGSAERTAREPREKPRGSAEHSSLSLPGPVLEGGGGASPAPPRERPRDEVFDFLAELTGSDPKVHASRIGRLKKLLLAANPPYTLAEIRTLGDPTFLARELPYLRGTKPSVSQVESVIGRIRSPSPHPANQRSPPYRAVPTGEQLDEYAAGQAASIFDDPPEDGPP